MAIAAIAAVAGLALQAYGQNQARKAGKQANLINYLSAQEDLKQARIKRQQSDIENVRRAKETVRQALIERGEIIGASAAENVQHSSGAIAARRDPVSRAKGEIATANRQDQLDDEIFASQTYQAQLGVRLGDVQNKAADAMQMAQIGSMVMGVAGGYGSIYQGMKKYFSGTGTGNGAG